MSSRRIKKVACIGAGLIGASWGVNFLLKGKKVAFYDVSDEILEKAKAQVRRDIQFLVDQGIYGEEIYRQVEENSVYTKDIAEALEGADFVQESGPENYEVKGKILEAVDEYALKDVIFASSTSGLLISEIAKKSKHPQRCIGAHPYNPPHLIPLVEITKGPDTDEEVIEGALSFYKEMGKEPIVLQKEALGFIANRLQVALYREVVDLVIRGVCSVEDADKATCFGPGLRFGVMGPSLLFELGGGPYGISGILHHIGPSVENWWKDMAKWDTWPEGWEDIAVEGVKQEIENRTPEEGNTKEDLIKFRDSMLIEMLKLHNKL